jgi:hypothetical protein
MVKATFELFFDNDHKKALKLISQLGRENVGIQLIKSYSNKIVFKAPQREAVYAIIEELTKGYNLLGTIENIKIRGKDEKDYSKYLGR